MADLLCMGEPMLEFNQFSRSGAGLAGGTTWRGMAATPPTPPSRPPGKARAWPTSPRSALDAPATGSWRCGRAKAWTPPRDPHRPSVRPAVYFVTHDAAGHALPATTARTSPRLPLRQPMCRMRRWSAGRSCSMPPASARASRPARRTRCSHAMTPWHGARRAGCLRHQLPPAPVAGRARGGGDPCGVAQSDYRLSRHGGRGGADRADRPGRDRRFLPAHGPAPGGGEAWAHRVRCWPRRIAALRDPAASRAGGRCHRRRATRSAAPSSRAPWRATSRRRRRATPAPAPPLKCEGYGAVAPIPRAEQVRAAMAARGGLGA